MFGLEAPSCVVGNRCLLIVFGFQLSLLFVGLSRFRALPRCREGIACAIGPEAAWSSVLAAIRRVMAWRKCIGVVLHLHCALFWGDASLYSPRRCCWRINWYKSVGYTSTLISGECRYHQAMNGRPTLRVQYGGTLQRIFCLHSACFWWGHRKRWSRYCRRKNVLNKFYKMRSTKLVSILTRYHQIYACSESPARQQHQRLLDLNETSHSERETSSTRRSLSKSIGAPSLQARSTFYCKQVLPAGPGSLLMYHTPDSGLI